MQVRDVLKTKGGRVISIDPEASVAEAIGRLVQNNIGSLPVVDSEGHLVGILADRGLDGERTLTLPFFGEPARFPVGPFRLATILKRPIVFMTGLYRGGARYDIHFELLAEPGAAEGESVEQAIERTMRRYVARLEHYSRSAPYNWFNFYDFWV